MVGTRVLLTAQAGRLLGRLLRSILHFSEQPSLTEVLERVKVVTNARAVISSLNLSLDVKDWNRWCQHYAELEETLDQRYTKSASLNAPINYRVERETGLLLYALVRLGRPGIVVETGVANGHSSMIILSALDANGFGELHSFDISSSVGSLVNETERSRWTMHVCPRRSAGAEFQRLVEDLGPVDLFLHDSDHSYVVQLADLLSVWPVLSPGATIVVDDVNEAWAFFDFVQARDGVAIGLFDSRKLAGVFTNAA
jgi:predicted O-methyltransferase YrrM